MSLLDFGWTADDEAQSRSLESRVNISKAIIGGRMDRGLTQAQLAEAAQTTQPRISAIEALDGNPRLDTLERIASALQMCVDFVPRKCAVPPVVEVDGYRIVTSKAESVRTGPTAKAEPISETLAGVR